MSPQSHPALLPVAFSAPLLVTPLYISQNSVIYTLLLPIIPSILVLTMG